MSNSRTTSWDDPTELARYAFELSGIEFLQKLINEQRKVPIGSTLGFAIVEAGDGYAVFEAEAGPWCFNPIGSVHGGWYSAVLDAPLGCALHSTLPAGVGYTTLEIKTNIVRAVQRDTGVLKATGKLVHRGRTTAVTEARMEDKDGRLYAYASSTCLILKARKHGISENKE